MVRIIAAFLLLLLINEISQLHSQIAKLQKEIFLAREHHAEEVKIRRFVLEHKQRTDFEQFELDNLCR